MNFNSIIFPAPIEDKKKEISRYKDELMFIPKKTKSETFHIPCLVQYSKRKSETHKFLFYFHGNAEDIFNSTANLDLLRNTLPYNTVAIEYPGYSVYYKDKSAEVIEEDALIVYDFFVKVAGVHPKDITICGRSIGTGPAVYLAAKRDPAGLVLISPFKSIRETAGSILGFFKFIIADRFRNIDMIGCVTCPVLFIHGQKDTLIDYSHTIELSKNAGGPYEVLLPEEMDHNEFNLYEDFLEPISSFYKRHNLLNESKSKSISFPKEVFDLPEYISKDKNIKQNDFLSKFIRKIMKI